MEKVNSQNNVSNVLQALFLCKNRTCKKNTLLALFEICKERHCKHEGDEL